jgi:hypothetical protein
MNWSVLELATLCGLLFALSLLLFVITGARRRKLDAALRRAAVSRHVAADAPQLGMFGEWVLNSQTVLVEPERRWSYDQDYMVAFIEQARSQHITGSPHGATALNYYANSILRLDFAFAVCFALFIVSAALLIADCGSLWLARICIWSGCMGVLYGVADVGEDIKLRGIFDHAGRIAAVKLTGTALQRDTALADAAQVDAANTLTRVKIVMIWLSGTGIVAFCLLLVADKLVSLLPGSGSPSSGATTG